MDFIKIEKPEQRVSEENMDLFIERFNGLLSEGKMTANTGLDYIPTLNEKEFELVRAKAHNMGYNLSVFDDNYNTITYKLDHV